jgi:thiol:disulfide interchange protein
MKYLMLLILLTGCTQAPAYEPDRNEAAAIVAGQIAFYQTAESGKPDIQTTCKECKGAKKVKSGDGLAMVPCSCGENCKCVKETGQVQALPQNRMLMFTATWCDPCQIWKRDESPQLKAQDWIISGANDAHIQVIDTDQQPGVTQQYNVRSIPQFIMIDPQGNVVARSGYLDAVQTADFFYENQR